MQWKQLAHFVAVAEHGSFSQAARESYIAQSSLSQSVLTLEQELGFPLLKRGREGARLTDMGEQVYHDAKELLDRVEGLTQQWKKTYQDQCALQGHLRIGAVPGSHPILINRVLEPLKESCPKLSFNVLEVRDGLLLELLAQRKADLILGVSPEEKWPETEEQARKQNLELLKLRRDSYKIALSKHHALADRTDLTAGDVMGLPLACFFGGDRAAEQYFELGFDPALRVEYTSFDKMIHAAREGSCVSVLPELTVCNSLPLLGGSREDLRFLTVNGFCVPFYHFIGIRRDEPRSGEMDLILRRLRRIFGEELN